MEIKDIYQKYWKPLNYYAQSIVRSKEDSEDIVSSVFERSLKHPERFETLENLKSYLFAAVHNACFNFLRKHTHVTESTEKIYELFFSDEDPYGDLYEVKMEVIQLLIEQLNPEQRKLYVAFYVDGLEITEIMDLHHMKRETIRSNKRYMLDTLRKLILPYKKLIYNK